MATTPKEATCAGHSAPAAAGGSAVVVRRENASASGVAEWGVPSATEDLQGKNLASLIRPDPASKAITKGLLSSISPFINRMKYAFRNLLFYELFYSPAFMHLSVVLYVFHSVPFGHRLAY